MNCTLQTNLFYDKNYKLYNYFYYKINRDFNYEKNTIINVII